MLDEVLNKHLIRTSPLSSIKTKEMAKKEETK